MPAVGILLPLTVSAYIVLSAVTGELLPPRRPRWLLEVGADVLFVAAWYWLLLALLRRRQRYRQTASALFGLQTVLAAPIIIADWLARRFATEHAWQLPISIVAIALAIWILVASAHILRAALERSLAWCLLLALAQMLIEELVLMAIFGAGA